MKILKRIFFLVIIISLGINICSRAQSPGDRIKSKRIAYFTDKLQLTPDEAQKFWPVFNEYDQKKNAINAEKRKLTESFRNNYTNMSETEVDKTINILIKLSQQDTELFEDYNKKFRTILSAQKVMKLYLAETEFKVILLRELKANTKSGIAD